MVRKLNFVSATFAMMTIVLMCTLANAQTKPGSTPAPTPTPAPQNQFVVNSHTQPFDLRTAAKGWDGKVQGRQLVTPLVLTFDSPADYDNFAAGKLKLNLILKNAVSGGTSRLPSKLLTENFRIAPTRDRLAIDVVIDNMTAPLSEAACGEIRLGAENTADGSGVDITLSYSGCDSGPAQRTAGQPVTGVIVKGGSNAGSQRTAGNPIGGIIVKGGKNPGGNLSIVLGDPRIVTQEAAAKLPREAGMIVIRSSRDAASGMATGK